MKIQNQNIRTNHFNHNFKAREFALIKTRLTGVEQNFKAYSVDSKDVCFLDTMSSHIVLKKLTQAKQFNNKILSMWKNIINNAIMMAGFDEPQRTYLLVNGNKPCSIMSYKNTTNAYVDNVASWPVKVNEYIKLAGTSMFKLLFYNAEKDGIKNIFLDYAKNSPINLNAYYQSLGFDKNLVQNRFATDMIISRTKFLEVSKKMDSIIHIKEIENPKTVNLKEIMNIDYISVNQK